MEKKTTLTLAEAAVFQSSFDAVIAGKATEAEKAEVAAVVIGLVHYTRDVGGLVDGARAARVAFLASIDAGSRAKVLEALGDDPNAKPRLWWDHEAKTLVTPETEAEVAASKLPAEPVVQ